MGNIEQVNFRLESILIYVKDDLVPRSLGLAALTALRCYCVSEAVAEKQYNLENNKLIKKLPLVEILHLGFSSSLIKQLHVNHIERINYAKSMPFMEEINHMRK